MAGTIAVIGISRATTSVEGFELATQRHASLIDHLRDFRNGGVNAEFTVLKTCNRIEAYLAGPDVNDELFSKLAALLSSDSNDTYMKKDAAALQHLFRVASGIESPILGEAEILTQCRAAIGDARKHGFAGKILVSAFEWAMRCGRRVRARTSIAQGTTSIVQAVCNLTATAYSFLPECNVLIFGAGTMATAIAFALRRRGVTTFVIANRTTDRANHLASRIRGVAIDLDHVEVFMQTADVVITATSADTPIITRSVINKVMAARGQRELAIVDLGAPRNVADDVDREAGVTVYNLTAIEAVAEVSIEERNRIVRAVEAAIALELRAYAIHSNTEINAVIRGAIDMYFARTEEEIQKLRKFIPDDQFQVVRDVADKLSKNLMHEVLSRIRRARLSGAIDDAALLHLLNDRLNFNTKLSNKERSYLRTEASRETDKPVAASNPNAFSSRMVS